MYNYLITQQQHYNNSIICFAKFIAFIDTLNFPYCYIVHDEEKDVHVHILLLNCDLKKTDLLNYDVLKTSDITIVDNLGGTLDYLTHKNDNTKHRYDEKDVIFRFCSCTSIMWEDELIKRTNKKSRTEKIMEDIANDIIFNGYHTYKEIFLKYGGISFKFYRTIIDMIEQYKYLDLNLYDD